MGKVAPKRSAKKKPAAKPVKAAAKKILLKSPPAKAAKSAAPIAKSNGKSAGPTRAAVQAKAAAAAKAAPAPKAAPKAMAAAAAKPVPKKKSPKLSEIVLPPGYMPSESEPFMNEKHRVYFRNKLTNWKEEIIKQNRETLDALHDDTAQHADLADRATSETDRALELRARDRQRKLIAKIDSALARIEDGTYGYCEETGEPIGLRRLDARPIATLSLEAQERHERRERVFRED